MLKQLKKHKVKQRLDYQQEQIEELQARLRDVEEDTRIDALDTTLNQRLNAQGGTLCDFRSRLDTLEGAFNRGAEVVKRLDALEKTVLELQSRVREGEQTPGLEAEVEKVLRATIYSPDARSLGSRLDALEKLVNFHATYAQNLSDRLDKLEMATAPATACDESVVSDVPEGKTDGEPAVPNAVDLALLVRYYRNHVGLEGNIGVRLIQTAERVLAQPGPKPKHVEPMIPARLVRGFFNTECEWLEETDSRNLYEGQEFEYNEAWRVHCVNALALIDALEAAEREAHK